MVGVRLKAELRTASVDLGPPLLHSKLRTPNSEPRTQNSKPITPSAAR